MNQLEQRLLEAFDQLWGDFVDPREPYTDTGDDWWMPVASATGPGQASSGWLFDEGQHRQLREQCRALAATNEFAINGHENRISYIVGTGHTYRATAKKGTDPPLVLVRQVQQLLEAFLRDNQWHTRQQETVHRLDRDGEVFLRHFVAPDGGSRVRFVEPDQIVRPAELAAAPHASFGIETVRDDVETVLAYFVDGQRVPAAEIQHRKANVDRNVKRGVPLFAPVRKNLRRVEKLLRNMSVVAEIQSAIALIRKHRGATRTAVQQFVSGQADVTHTDSQGNTQNLRQFGPGTILDAPAGLEYDFPATGIDASAYVSVLQAELRTIASRLVMPEFMLTSDASNANFSSTMVAEGPAIKMFARLQASQMEADLEVMWHVIKSAIAAGRLPHEVEQLIEIQVMPPTLITRDQVDEARANSIAFDAGILSPQTWSQRLGLDYDQERKNMQTHHGADGVAKNET